MWYLLIRGLWTHLRILGLNCIIIGWLLIFFNWLSGWCHWLLVNLRGCIKCRRVGDRWLRCALELNLEVTQNKIVVNKWIDNWLLLSFQSLFDVLILEIDGRNQVRCHVRINELADDILFLNSCEGLWQVISTKFRWLLILTTDFVLLFVDLEDHSSQLV